MHIVYSALMCIITFAALCNTAAHTDVCRNSVGVTDNIHVKAAAKDLIALALECMASHATHAGVQENCCGSLCSLAYAGFEDAILKAGGLTRVFWALDHFQVNLWYQERFPSRVRHTVAIYGRRLLFCDQCMHEKAWRNRKRGV